MFLEEKIFSMVGREDMNGLVRLYYEEKNLDFIL